MHLPSTYILQTLLISTSLVLLPYYYLVQTTNHEAHNYVVFSNLGACWTCSCVKSTHTSNTIALLTTCSSQLWSLAKTKIPVQNLDHGPVMTHTHTNKPPFQWLDTGGALFHHSNSKPTETVSEFSLKF